MMPSAAKVGLQVDSIHANWRGKLRHMTTKKTSDFTPPTRLC